VHTKTLGGSEEYAYKSKPTAIERLEDGFRVERWHMDADGPPFHKKVVRNAGRVDRRNIARMYVPGIFFMETLFSPAGSGAEKGNLQGAKQYRNCQFFTPETERSTHFFWDYLHDYDLDDPAIALSLNQSMIDGFLEDKFIIEGQQEVLAAPTLAISPSLYAKLAYDPQRDLAPVGLVAAVPNVMVTHPSVPARTLQEFIALAKSRPGELNFGSGGRGTSNHLGGELFNM